MKHKEQSEYVDRTQRLYKTALTRALKIKTTPQHKFKFGNFMLKLGYSRRSNNMTRKRIPHINNTVTEKNEHLYLKILLFYTRLCLHYILNF